MKRREAHLTDEQMNELVFADVNDPSAWGDPIAVRASKGPRRIRQGTSTRHSSLCLVLPETHPRRAAVLSHPRQMCADVADIGVIVHVQDASDFDSGECRSGTPAHYEEHGGTQRYRIIPLNSLCRGGTCSWRGSGC